MLSLFISSSMSPNCISNPLCITVPSSNTQNTHTFIVIQGSFPRTASTIMWGQLAGRVADSVKDVDVRRAMSRVVDVVAPEIEDDEEEDHDEMETPRRRGLIGYLSRVIPQDEEEYEDVYEEFYEEEDGDDEEEGEFVEPSTNDNWLDQPPKQEQPTPVEKPKLTIPTKVTDKNEWIPKREEPSKVEPMPVAAMAEPTSSVRSAKQKIAIPSRSTMSTKSTSTTSATSTKLVLPISPLIVTKTVPAKNSAASPLAETKMIVPVVNLPAVETTLSVPDDPPILEPISYKTSSTMENINNNVAPSPLIHKKMPVLPSPLCQKKLFVRKESSPSIKGKSVFTNDTMVPERPSMELKNVEAEGNEILTTMKGKMQTVGVNPCLRHESSDMESVEINVKTKIPTMADKPVRAGVKEKSENANATIPAMTTTRQPNTEAVHVQAPTTNPSIPETHAAALQPVPRLVAKTEPHAINDSAPILYPVSEISPLNPSPLPVAEEMSSDYAASMRVANLEQRCKTLERQLENAEQHIVAMQLETAKRMDEDDQWRQEILLKAKQDQARLLEASSEAVIQDHQQEMINLRQSLEKENLKLRDQLQEENAAKNLQILKLERQLDEVEAKAKATASEMQNALVLQNASSTQLQQRQQHSARLAEDKLALTLALLDDKGEEVENLKTVIKELKATVMKNQEGSHAIKMELEELRKENEILHHNIEVTEEEQEELQKQLEHLEGHELRSSKLQLELQMLKETRDRELAKSQSTVADVTTHKSNLEMERNTALARARDLDQQLTVALADVEVARSDAQRAMTSNANLQRALESFQSEREAELGMLEEAKHRDEKAAAAAHAAAIQATYDANETKIREVKYAADTAIKKLNTELQVLKGRIQEYEKDNLHLRRSLDEAIYRLQSTQEDVVDRTMMKNIILDWFSKTGKNKKQVLELMASMLHFTDGDKEKCHIYEGTGSYEKFVGAVVAPLPAPAKEVDTLEGENVREKWVNFLLAETDDVL